MHCAVQIGAEELCAAQLEKPLVVPYQQISHVVRDGKTVTTSGLKPRKLTGFVLLAGVDFSADHLKRYPQSLDSINAGAPPLDASFGPFNFKSTDPISFSLFRRMDPDRHLNAAVFFAQDKSSRSNDHGAPQNGNDGSGCPRRHAAYRSIACVRQEPQDRGKNRKNP